MRGRATVTVYGIADGAGIWKLGDGVLGQRGSPIIRPLTRTQGALWAHLAPEIWQVNGGRRQTLAEGFRFAGCGTDPHQSPIWI